MNSKIKNNIGSMTIRSGTAKIKEQIQKQIDRKRLKLSARQFLVSLLELPMGLFAFHPYYNYRQVYRGYKKWQRQDRLRYYSILYQLKKKELIIFDYEEGIKPELPKLTEAGRKKALKYLVQEINPSPPKTWDHRWRLIIFDVPDKKKLSREFVREELKRIGFFKLQKSVFIYPFECKDEIEFIRLAAGLSKYNLCYLRVDNFDLSPQVLNFFIKERLLNPKELSK